jgi:hypothetical protein
VAVKIEVDVPITEDLSTRRQRIACGAPPSKPPSFVSSTNDESRPRKLSTNWG